MAWTVPTYAGTYMGGTPSNARTAMFELCRAVNERQAALALTKTEFFKADGTEAADITLADILNIRAAGVESNAEKNLKRVRGAIIAMLAGASFDPVFTTSHRRARRHGQRCWPTPLRPSILDSAAIISCRRL
jgi:hypothetical protein